MKKTIYDYVFGNPEKEFYDEREDSRLRDDETRAEELLGYKPEVDDVA